MYELKHIGIEQLMSLKPALSYQASNYASLEKALELYGPRVVWVNRNTMHLLSNRAELEVIHAAKTDGHALPYHMGAGWEVPTVLGAWPDHDEARIALILNGGIDALLRGIPARADMLQILLGYDESSFEDILALGTDFDHYQHILDSIAGTPAPDAPAAKRDGWDIPTLNSALQGEAVYSLLKWGTNSKKAQRESTIHFYTDDYKFAAMLDNPEKLMSRSCTSAIEINCSTDHTTPRAVALWQIYKKRYAATIWQAAGIRVFVDLNVERQFFDLALLGVPEGWTAYANRGYARDTSHLEDAYELARRHAGREITYIVYGGGQEAKALCERRGWHWFIEQAQEIRSDG